MAKTVSDFLIKLGVDGIQGVEAIKSSLRGLSKAAGPADKDLRKIRTEILEFANAGQKSTQAIRGVIESFKGLQAQASINSSVYKQLAADIEGLEGSLEAIKPDAEKAAEALERLMQVNIPSKAPGDFAKNMEFRRQQLQGLKADSEEYLKTLVGIKNFEAQQAARIARQEVSAQARVAATGLPKTILTMEQPETLAALRLRIGEVQNEIENLDFTTDEYANATKQLIDLQQELKDVLEGTSDAFRKLEREKARTARRAEKLAGVDAATGGAGINPRTGTPMAARDPKTGVMIAGGSAVAAIPTPLPELSSLYKTIVQIESSGVNATLDRMGKSVKQVTRDIKAATVASNGSVNSLQAQRNAFVQLQAGLDPVSQDFRELSREIEQVDRKLGKLGKKRFNLKGAAQTVGAVASAGIFGGAPGLAGALIGAPFGPGGAAVGGGLGASAGVAAQQISGFTNYAASIRLAEKAMERILQKEDDQVESARRVALANETIEYAVNKLNVEREDATVGMTRLGAAVLGAGGNIETAALAFLGTTKAIKATKGSAEDVRGGLTALVQMFSKGRISAEELSGQLGERFPAAVTAFAEANDISGQELQKMLKNGEVGLDRLVKFLVFVTKKYSDGALGMAASAEESGERQKRAFDEVRRELGEQLVDVGSKLQEGIADSLATLTPVIVNTAKAVAKAVELIVKGIVVVIKNFRNLIDAVTVLAGGAVLGTLLAMLTKVKIAMGAKGFAFSVALLARFIRFKLNTAVGALILKLKALAVTMAKNPITLLALGITALGVSMFRASQRHKDFIDDITSGVMSLEDAGKGLERYKQRLEDINKIQALAAKNPAAVASGLREAAKTSRQLQLDGVAGEVQALAQGLQDSRLPAISVGTIEALSNAEAVTSTFISGIEAAIAGRAGGGEGIDLEELMSKAFAPSLSLDGSDSGGKKDISDAMMQARINGMRQVITLADVEAKLANDLLQINIDDLEVNERIVAKAQAYFNAEQSRLQIEQQLLSLQESIAAQVDKAMLATGEMTQEQFNQNELERRRVELKRELLPLLLSQKKTEEEIEEIIEKILKAMKEGQDKSKSFVDGLKELIKEATNLNDLLAERGVQAVDQFSNAFADFVATGKANFKELTASILQDLSRIFARAAFMKALGLAFPSLVQNADGNVIANNKIVPYARGGIVKKPTLFPMANGVGLMGEAGPEAIMPLRRGRNGKLGVESSGSIGNVVVNVDASGSSAQGDQPNAKALGQAIGAAVQAELIKQKRPGGLLS